MSIGAEKAVALHEVVSRGHIGYDVTDMLDFYLIGAMAVFKGNSDEVDVVVSMNFAQLCLV